MANNRSESFVREQIGLCLDFYLKARPASRQAFEAAAHMSVLRTELAGLIRARRAARRPVGAETQPAAHGAACSPKARDLIRLQNEIHDVIARAWKAGFDAPRTAEAVRGTWASSHAQEIVRRFKDEQLVRSAMEQEAVEAVKADFNRAINFAITQGIDAAVFLDAWRHGDTSEWPEYPATSHTRDAAHE